MQRSKPTALAIVVALLALSLVVVSFAALLAWRQLNGTITISSSPNLEVYSDSGMTVVMTSFNVVFTGSEAQGTTKIVNIWLRNIGNTPITVRWNLTGPGFSYYAPTKRYSSTAWTAYLTTQADQATRLGANETSETTKWSATLAMGASVALELQMVQDAAPPVAAGTVNFSPIFSAYDA